MVVIRMLPIIIRKFFNNQSSLVLFIVNKSIINPTWRIEIVNTMRRDVVFVVKIAIDKKLVMFENWIKSVYLFNSIIYRLVNIENMNNVINQEKVIIIKNLIMASILHIVQILIVNRIVKVQWYIRNKKQL